MQTHPCDRLGRRYTPAQMSEQLIGREAPNKGRTFPAEVLSADEVNRLLAGCSRRGKTGVRTRAMILMAWRTGLRIAELLALELRDVDRDAGTITVRRGKGHKRRVVGFDQWAWPTIERWLDVRAALGVTPRSGPLFCTISAGNIGSPVTYTSVRGTLLRAAARAELDKRVHWHGLRHTFAVHMLRGGADLKLIQKALGHSSLGITDRYLDHLEPRAVIDHMGARERPEAITALAS